VGIRRTRRRKIHMVPLKCHEEEELIKAE